MKPTIFTIALLQSVTAATPIARDDISKITYKGLLSDSGTVEYFHGIRYALDTSGIRRFAPPVPVSQLPEGSVVDATQRAPACPQLQIDLPPIFNKPPEISEDCLSVFIARPANIDHTKHARLPVLAWVPGGGAMYGSPFDPHTNPEKLLDLSVALNEPVIFVGINYRLSIFGFAASDELQAQKSQNIGLRDQRLAFEWLKKNIAVFGGDPDRITAYGLSAGGTLLSLHHIAYGGEQGVPFDQVFIMSGPPGTARNQTTDGVKINTAIVADRLGCPVTGQEMLDCMREVDMSALVKVAYNYAVDHHPPYGLFTYIPVADGDFIPDRGSKLIHRGNFVKNVPMIIAWTEDDGATNAGPASIVHDEQSLLKAIEMWTAPFMTDTQLVEFLDLYPFSDFEGKARQYKSMRSEEVGEVSPHWYRGAAFIRDLLFTCSSIDFAHQMYKHTRSSGINSNFDSVWLYQLNQSMLGTFLSGAGMDYIGAAHGSDINYIFNGVFLEGDISDADVALSRTFASSVIHFAHTGVPTKSDGNDTFPSWPPAFGQHSATEDDSLMPYDFNLLVVGGPYGTNPIHVSASAEEAGKTSEHGNTTYDRIAEGVANAQQAVLHTMGRMDNAATAIATDSVRRQRLFERCRFVNSLAETIGF